jgi:Fe-S-cluster-containing hydrogenase component 2
VPAIVADLCTGCEACVLACAYAREGLAHPDLSRIRIRRRGEKAAFQPLLCLQCVSPPCVKACPACAREKVEGMVRVHEENCIGCGACVQACPSGAVRMHSARGVSFSCDGCHGSPACVKACAPGALRFGDPGIVTKLLMRYSALSGEGAPSL